MFEGVETLAFLVILINFSILLLLLFYYFYYFITFSILLLLLFYYFYYFINFTILLLLLFYYFYYFITFTILLLILFFFFIVFQLKEEGGADMKSIILTTDQIVEIHDILTVKMSTLLLFFEVFILFFASSLIFSFRSYS